MDIVNTNMPVVVYSQLKRFNDIWSEARCRIFYKGLNRNGSYITDEFAEKLIKTLPYAPVKGIYDSESRDFTDHGEARTDGRIYGIVPADPDIQWEEHEDEDGVTRNYVTSRVLICTGIYSEANQIVGKAQSMELYQPSIKGDWKVIDGKKCYVFTDASFGGLQALGDDTEPCFEGAAFFNLFTAIKDLIATTTTPTNNKGGIKMPGMNFKLSDSAKYEALWSMLNPEYTEEGNWTIEYGIVDVYDEYALAVNYETRKYERVYYTKNEDDTVSITERRPCFLIDVDENEYNALKALHAMNGETYAAIDTKYSELQTQNSELGQKISESEAALSTLNIEKDGLTAQLAEANSKLEAVNTQYAAAQSDLATVTAERDTLASYKKDNETAKKMAIVESYRAQLSDEVIDSFVAKLDTYDERTLDMELTYALKSARPESFTQTPAVQVVPKDITESGLSAILAKYEKH